VTLMQDPSPFADANFELGHTRFMSLESLAEFLLVHAANLNPADPQERDTAARFLKASSTQRYQQLPRTARADAPASRPASSFPAATGPTTAGDLADRRAAGGV